jgi:cell fate regulator YaaT (PSP1 superfamily)
MNEYVSPFDALQQHRDDQATEPATYPETAREERSIPNRENTSAAASGTGDRTTEATPPPPEQGGDLPPSHENDVPVRDDVTEGAATATTPPPETAPTGVSADAPPAETRQEESVGQAHACGGCPAQQGEEGDLQQRRVVLKAGTDEESLKALALCREKVSQLHLRMHPLAARWESDRHVVIFFRADEKVDFRKLVRELSRLLHARIELRQVGPREQGKLCGLVGKCGYPLCCQTFLGQFAQSTIKMAKTQELALNPMKISGVCGRLLCCLNYEQEMYLDAKSRMPRVNRTVDTEFGPGRVVAVNVLKETVTVQLETMTKELRPDQIRPSEVQG